MDYRKFIASLSADQKKWLIKNISRASGARIKATNWKIHGTIMKLIGIKNMPKLLAIGLCSLTATSMASDWPDLLGTWTGTTRSVIIGDGGHFSGGENSQNAEFHEIELTIQWTNQQDGRYIGSITSPKHSEPKLGVVSRDHKTIFTVDTDGQSVGELIDDNHFELCYMQTSSEDSMMVASCVIFERQPEG